MTTGIDGPTLLYAATVNVYDELFVRPVTLYDVSVINGVVFIIARVRNVPTPPLSFKGTTIEKVNVS